MAGSVQSIFDLGFRIFWCVRFSSVGGAGDSGRGAQGFIGDSDGLVLKA